MGLGDRLAFLVGADGVAQTIADFGKVGTAARAAAAETQAQLDKLTASAEAAEAKAATAEEKVARGIGGPTGVAKNQAAADAANAEAAKARQGIASIESDAPGASGALAGIGVSGGVAGAAVAAGMAAAGAAVLGFTVAGIRSFVSLTDTVRDFQSVSGASAQDASKLVFAAKALGVPVDALSTSIYRLGANVDTQPQKFAQWGVQIAKTKAGTTDLLGTFNNVIERMNALGQGADADALAKALVGRGAATLAPLAQEYQTLIQLEQQAQGAGGVVSQADVQKGLDYKVAISELGSQFQSLERDLASGVLPTLTGMVGGFDRLIADVKTLTGEIPGLGTVLKDAVPGIGGFVGIVLKQLGDGTSQSAKTQAEAAITAQNYASALAQEQQAAQDAATAQDQLDTAVKGARDAAIAVVDTDQAVTDAQNKVNEARLAGAQKAKDLATAENQLQTAKESVIDATTALAEAEATAAEKPARDAIALADAHFAVTDALKAEAVAVLEYGANSEEAAKAAEAVATARLNEGDTTRKAGEPDTSVQKAKDALAAANQSIASAQDAINKAEAEDPAATLKTAEDNLAKAVIARADAQDAAKKKIDDSTISTNDLKVSFDAMIADMTAAGVDPATIAVFQNIEDAALAARAAIDQSTGQSVSGTPIDGPGTEAGDAARNRPVAPTPPPPPPAAGGDVGAGTSSPPATSSGSGARTQSVTNITVNANTNADPNEIAHAVVFAQAVRR